MHRIRKHNRRQHAFSGLVAGIALVGLAACQPVPGVPSFGNDNGESGGTSTTSTTPAAPTTTVAPTNPNNTPPVNAPAGYRFAGGDEFDGSALNTNAWSAYHNTYGDGNNELACLQPSNLSLTGGSLRIAARKENVTCPGNKKEAYTSGFIGSRETGTYFPRYGRFEMRAKLPHSQGLWPAFWLRHRNGSGVAEVDVMEYFHSQVPGKTTSTLHLDGRHNLSKRSVPFEAPTLNGGWHTWAVDIAPSGSDVKFTFFVDGAEIHSYVDTQHNWTSADPNGTWDIALNLAVGGNWTGAPDDTLGYLRDLNRCSISGSAPGGCSTNGIRRIDWNQGGSTTYEVDYVRVYARS